MTKDEALRMALEALEPFGTPRWAGTGVDKANEAITAIKEALAQPEQEPINDGWQITFANGHSGFGVYAHMDEYPEEGSRLLCAVPQWAKDALKATTPPLCPTCEALARTVMMDQTGKDT